MIRPTSLRLVRCRKAERREYNVCTNAGERVESVGLEIIAVSHVTPFSFAR